MQVHRIFICFMIIFMASACAGAFQHPQTLADCGIAPQNYENTIKDQFEKMLKDPDSARYKFGQPVRAYSNGGLIFGGKVEWAGYLVDVNVNGKNSYGGYSGFRPYMALFSGNQLVRIVEGSEDILVHRME